MKKISYIPAIIILVTAIVLTSLLLAGGMVKIYSWYLLQILLPLAGLVGIIFSVIRWIALRRFDRIVEVTGVLAILAILPAGMMLYPLPYPSSLEHTSPSATVRLPANELLKVAWGGDTRAVNQHVVVPDQRWAYDFVVEPYFNGSSALTDYGCYGIPVVAPISGLVWAAHDGEPDMAPGSSSNNYKTPRGNYVVIKLDDTGTYLEIAHLKPGSVTVISGQRVEEGQVIGQCGNSGNTSEPHIHIHHQRQDPEKYPVNFAEGLPLYFKDLYGSPMPEGGITVIDGAAVATGDTVLNLGNKAK